MMVIGRFQGHRHVSNEGTTPVSMPSHTRFARPLRLSEPYTHEKQVTIGCRLEGGANHHVGGPISPSATILVRRGEPLANFSKIVKQLQKERAQVERKLWGLDAAIRAFATFYTGEQHLDANGARCRPRAAL